ncbi:hypothetical protein [Kribbella sp. NPDC004875]|uniref:hypothetical protein n=1 Tax=Kribbella sp. NPDC004875 TaxID=3364107 RepID=UPI0036AF9AF3
MIDAQRIVSSVLVAALVLLPVGLITYLVGRRRSNRFVLKWAQAVGVLSTALATGYVVAWAVCLILADTVPDTAPGIPGPGAYDFPVFLMPAGGAVVLAAWAVLGSVVRTRRKMG